jgi:hypothetical protein
MQTIIGEEQLFCVNHPQTETALRCSKCLDPICLRCAQRTPVGLRCPKCTGAARGRDGTYFVPALLSQVTQAQYLKATLAALAVAALGGIGWGQFRFAGGFGDWSFWFALLLGLLSGEVIARVVNERRGPWLQIIAALAVLLAAAIAGAWTIMVGRGLPMELLGELLASPGGRSLAGLTLTNGLFVAFGMFVATQRLRL